MSSPGAVVIAAGGTGGHIYPALAVARVLELRKIPIIWVGTRDGLESRIVPEANIDIRWIRISGIRGKGLKGMLTGPFKLLTACLQSRRILADVNASAVLGMGGFVSGPVGLAALFTRRPLVLHEQNAVAGMTNKWLGGFATRVFSAVPNVFPDKVKAKPVGNPVRKDIENIGPQKLNNTVSANEPSAAKLNILIVGGSRGARALNELVPEAIARLQRNAPAIELSVWHQTGEADAALVEQRYGSVENAVSVNVAAYIDDVADAYRWADVIICRSGAMTVSELSAAALPGLLVPFPHHDDNQQTLNARFLSDAGAAVLMPQSVLTAESLATELQALGENPQSLADMARAAQALHKPDAATVIADALQELRR